LSLYRAAQAAALLAGRSYVVPDDVKGLAVAVLAHRVIPKGYLHEVTERTETPLAATLLAPCGRVAPGTATAGRLARAVRQLEQPGRRDDRLEVKSGIQIVLARFIHNAEQALATGFRVSLDFVHPEGLKIDVRVALDADHKTEVGGGQSRKTHPALLTQRTSSR
jgi:hypothetical protein